MPWTLRRTSNGQTSVARVRKGRSPLRGDVSNYDRSRQCVPLWEATVHGCETARFLAGWSDLRRGCGLQASGQRRRPRWTVTNDLHVAAGGRENCIWAN